MDKIGPKEAADTIRKDFLNEHADPRFLHGIAFAGDVCGELGVEKSPKNIAKVMRLLDNAGIEGHARHDYPSWVTNSRGERAVVADADHEQAFMDRPEPLDADGRPNPAYGHVDPNTGEFTAGATPTVYDIRQDGPNFRPPPYEPGAVDVIEPGGKKGPPASPVSDNRQNIQQNIDPMRGQSGVGQVVGDPQLVTKAKHGEVFVEPSNQHGEGEKVGLDYQPPFPADQTEWRTPEQIAAGLPRERPPYGPGSVPRSVPPRTEPESVG